MDDKGQTTQKSGAERDGTEKKEGVNPDVEKAHREADKDIAADTELSAHSPNDDLDEGETARLGEKDNGLV